MNKMQKFVFFAFFGILLIFDKNGKIAVFLRVFRGF
jgi:small neutral amino acid transporter SnatA (MarC family)